MPKVREPSLKRNRRTNSLKNENYEMLMASDIPVVIGHGTNYHSTGGFKAWKKVASKKGYSWRCHKKLSVSQKDLYSAMYNQEAKDNERAKLVLEKHIK